MTSACLQPVGSRLASHKQLDDPKLALAYWNWAQISCFLPFSLDWKSVFFSKGAPVRHRLQNSQIRSMWVSRICYWHYILNWYICVLLTWRFHLKTQHKYCNPSITVFIAAHPHTLLFPTKERAAAYERDIFSNTRSSTYTRPLSVGGWVGRNFEQA